jgi:hypothetical protein
MEARRVILLCALSVAGCVSTSDKLNEMPVAEVCYLGATNWEYRRAADQELKRRGEVCENYRDEIVAIHNRKLEAQRANRAQSLGPQGIQFPQDTMVRPGVLR